MTVLPGAQGASATTASRLRVVPDGSAPTRLFHGKCCIGDWDGPVWSPDGERVAFFDDADMSYGTWLVANADGTGEPQQITDIEARSWGQE